MCAVFGGRLLSKPSTSSKSQASRLAFTSIGPAEPQNMRSVFVILHQREGGVTQGRATPLRTYSSSSPAAHFCCVHLQSSERQNCLLFKLAHV